VGALLFGVVPIFGVRLMKKAILTCVGCGSTEMVDDSLDEKRNRVCKGCGAALIERRSPGSSTAASPAFPCISR